MMSSQNVAIESPFAPLAAQQLRVASYNIHQCVGWDGKRDPKRIATVIRELNAHIIGLQEVDSDSDGPGKPYQMDYLANATGLRAVAGPTLQRHYGDYGNLLLTSLEIADIRLIDLSVPSREPRGAIDVSLKCADQTIRVLVSHLGLRRSERRLQVQRLLQAIYEREAAFTILLSDINVWMPWDACLKQLGRCLPKLSRHRTFPSVFPVLSLDRICVSPAEAVVEMEVHQTPTARIASDHLPLKARIALSEPCGVAPSD